MRRSGFDDVLLKEFPKRVVLEPFRQRLFFQTSEMRCPFQTLHLFHAATMPMPITQALTSSIKSGLFPNHHFGSDSRLQREPVLI